MKLISIDCLPFATNISVHLLKVYGYCRYILCKKNITHSHVLMDNFLLQDYLNTKWLINKI